MRRGQALITTEEALKHVLETNKEELLRTGNCNFDPTPSSGFFIKMILNETDFIKVFEEIFGKETYSIRFYNVSYGMEYSPWYDTQLYIENIGKAPNIYHFNGLYV